MTEFLMPTRQNPPTRVAVLAMAGALLVMASPGRADDQAAVVRPEPQSQLAPLGVDKARVDRRARANDSTPPIPELRDETFRLMDAYLISNLQESLGLSDEQFVKALPLVKKLQSDRRDSARKRMQALHQMRRALASGSATEAGITDLLRELNSASADERAAALKNLDVLDAVLTPLQQAKYRVFEAEVDARLRHLLVRSQGRDRNPRR